MGDEGQVSAVFLVHSSCPVLNGAVSLVKQLLEEDISPLRYWALC